MAYKGDISHIAVFSAKFGAEGSTKSGSSYSTVTNSDIVLDPAMFKQGTKLYVKFIYHLKNSLANPAFIQVWRQNAASAVAGSEKESDGTNNWNILTTAWIDWSSESGDESYQIQLKRNTDGTVTFNSAIMIISTVAF